MLDSIDSHPQPIFPAREEGRERFNRARSAMLRAFEAWLREDMAAAAPEVVGTVSAMRQMVALTESRDAR